MNITRELCFPEDGIKYRTTPIDKLYLLETDPDEGFDGGWAGDAAHAGGAAPSPSQAPLIIQS